MFNTQDILKLWANDQKRREFVKNYKAWGVWFIQPKLDLTFYKYNLSGGGRVIAMEYLREPCPSEKPDNGDAVTRSKFYLQRGKYFEPSATSESAIAEHLKDLKANLTKERAA